MAARRLTQQFVDAQPLGKPQAIRDSDLKGFMVVVNKTSKSFVVQRDLWTGERGNRRLAGTRRVTIGRVGVMSLKEARDLARSAIAQLAAGRDPKISHRAGGPTLGEALNTYITWLGRKNRSPRTVAYYRYGVERYLGDWLDLPLAAIGGDARAIRTRHVALTENHGPYAANAAMRCLRAIYRHERHVDLKLPDCPVNSRDFNAETKREQFVAAHALPAWKARVDQQANPVRRDLQLFILFTGMRRRAACAARWEDFDESRAALRVPKPKGGAARAFDLPLSKFVLGILRRRREENAELFPGSPWIFPAHSRTGAVAETKGGGLPSAHVLRHSYSTLACAAGVPYVDLQLLLNHAAPRGVTGGYVHEQGLFERLREQQEKIAYYLLAHMDRPHI